MARRALPTLKKGAFSEVMAAGNKVHGPLVTLFWRESAERGVGIAVSRKVRTAVQRNRAKRRVRELLRRYEQQIPEGVQAVWLLQPEVAEIPFVRLVDEFERTMEALRERIGDGS
ncbi:MAG: ribonuclease P protein component [Calditrichaeota bacterium]|nr:ribonuclease P protein component [Calditrichota bacterium]